MGTTKENQDMFSKLTSSHHDPTSAGPQPEMVSGSGAVQHIAGLLPGSPHGETDTLTGDRLIVPDRIPLTPTRRLVVLIPDAEFDQKALAKRIWELASRPEVNVLYLSLSPGPNDLARTRRRLTDLASMTNYGHVKASIKVKVGRNWAQAVAEILHAGDLLVCMARHRATYRVLGRKTLGELLSTSFDAPVYLLGGSLAGPSRQRQKLLRAVLAWLLFFAVIAAFAGIQIWIDQEYREPLSTILLCISVAFELSLVLMVNEWTV
jgi:hypothetical protein